MNDSGPLLSVTDLSVSADRSRGPSGLILDGVSLEVEDNRVLAIVGESGSGKSMTAKSVIGLLPPSIHQVGGVIRFRGESLNEMTPKERASLRGSTLAMIPQDPLSSLNPVLRVGTQLTETIRHHRGVSRSSARKVAESLLERVHIDGPARVMQQYPHQLSGGMRQRVVSMIALSAQPSLVIADEPTTSLDVTIEKEFISLLRELMSEHGFGLVFITHDLALVSNFADEIVVMHSGKVVERGRPSQIFRSPEHPYTRVLLDAIPKDIPRAGSGTPEKRSN